MKKLNMLYLVIVIGLLQNCMSSNLRTINSNIDECKTKIIYNHNFRFKPEVNDAITIRDATIEGNDIKLKIEYVGGCGEKLPQLLSNGSFMESYPVQLHIWFDFEKKADCTQIIKEDFCFNLKELSSNYKNNYRTKTGTIILNLKDYKKRLFYTF